ncbi:MAG TPA: NfeD family protein [Gemmataceae bacterium]|nr:NfeD family protein [Gemmataceae bacterium]
MAQAIPIVELLLVVLGMALIVLELKAPGSFVFAGCAAVLFVLFFWMQANAGAPLIGLAVALFLLGLALVGIELTVLPAHVFPGVLGLVLVIASLVVAGLDRVPAALDDWRDVALEVIKTGLTAAGGFALALVAARYLPQIPVVNRLVLAPPELEETHSEEKMSLLGQVGIATSLLGFSGMARIADRRVDVVTEGECIPAGVAVRVIEVDGNRVVVTKA